MYTYIKIVFESRMYSVLQSDRNSFGGGDIVLDSLNILDQIYRSKYVRNIFTTILIVINVKLTLSKTTNVSPKLFTSDFFTLYIGKTHSKFQPQHGKVLCLKNCALRIVAALKNRLA